MIDSLLLACLLACRLYSAEKVLRYHGKKFDIFPLLLLSTSLYTTYTGSCMVFFRELAGNCTSIFLQWYCNYLLPRFHAFNIYNSQAVPAFVWCKHCHITLQAVLEEEKYLQCNGWWEEKLKPDYLFPPFPTYICFHSIWMHQWNGKKGQIMQPKGRLKFKCPVKQNLSNFVGNVMLNPFHIHLMEAETQEGTF